MDNWHATGIGASVIAGVCILGLFLAIAWGAACDITQNAARICS